MARQVNSRFALCSGSAVAFRQGTLILMQEVVGSIPRNRIFSLVIGRGVVGRAYCFGWMVFGARR